ncbi:calcium-binding protein [Paracoccus alkanivorans]|uniref:Peptidase M10 serralysin C-terminal domain-containing protein n=1 Tax=Paracoccus alkanivorans TaxID=2116655 RepID=A0A3M0MFP9_9RHOB|nr:calcium-binding protein [Paracoccus alkanivorans]RMC36506.1 hypothetical protein C9E81_07575 [Paracoccus alkanivorans]
MLSYRHVATHAAANEQWLSGVTDLEILTSNGQAMLLATTAFWGAGISSYALATPDRPLQQIDTLPFPAHFAYQREPDINLLNVNGEDFVHLTRLGGAEHMGVGLSPAGDLGGFRPLFAPGDIGAEITSLGQFSSPAGSFLYHAHRDSLELTVQRIGADGQLTGPSSIAIPLPDAHENSALDKIIETHVGEARFLVAISKMGDFISTHHVTDSGQIGTGMLHVGAMGTGYAVPTDISAIQAGGYTYVVAAAAGSSTLTVFRLLADGKLTPTDHILDEGYTSFERITSLETVTVGDRAYVFAGGVDDGLSIFTLQPDGRLLHLQTIADSNEMTLADVSDIEARLDDGKIDLFVSSATENGITQLQFDPGTIGETVSSANRVIGGTMNNDLLLAEAGNRRMDAQDGNDILIATASGIRMFGGAGADIFVPAHDTGRILIMDFEIESDRLDLSQLGIRSLYQVQFLPKAGGIKLRFHDATIEIATRDGTALTEADFSNDMFPIAHYNLPEIDPAEFGTDPPPVTVGRHIFGTDGADTLSGQVGPDVIRARAGDDMASGNAGNDAIHGDGGNDHLTGDDGNDRLHGGTGDDILSGSNDEDYLVGGTGNDVLFGNLHKDMLIGGSGDDTLYGGYGDDTLTDANGLNQLWGMLGNDRINGGAERDFVEAGAGDDIVFGRESADRIAGNDGNDTLRGDIGDDRIWGGEGDDKIYGNLYKDMLVGGSGNDSIYGGYGDDTLTDANGLNQLWGMLGNDRINGGAERDFVEAGAGDDIVFGGEKADRIAGNDGNDTLRGDIGDDRIWGGAGDDEIYGNLYKDMLVGGPGNDSIYGGYGDDTITDAEGLNQLWGMLGDDLITGGAERDFVEAGAGDDIVFGRESADRIAGNDGNDTLYGDIGDDRIWGGEGNDEIYGNLYKDMLVGGSGNDSIYGGYGDDTIAGSLGTDELVGGTGKDSFRFSFATHSSPDAPDIIRDFETGSDKMDLSSLGLVYIGNDVFTGSRQLKWEFQGADTRINIDIDGNGHAEMAFILSGQISLSEDDFLL